ncbi:hypothetical protein FRC07_014952, partial [Ceratobasidium sp. 392]
MARGGTMYQRTARRLGMTPPKLSRANGTDPNPSDETRRTCPYCGKLLDTEIGRDRHIILRTYCRARHKYVISGKKRRKRGRKSGTSTPSPEGTDSEPPTKRMRTDEDEQLVAGPSTLPMQTDDDEQLVAGPSTLPMPGPGFTVPILKLADLGTGDACAATGIFVERFPIDTAGAPISTQRRDEQGLPKYLESCGRLGDRDLFETAEILMTTGLTGQARNRHLRGPVYKKWKGKGVWKNNDELLSEIDKLPQGPKWTTAEVSAGEGDYERTYTVYLRDILEVIRQLIGARRFKRWMQYAPQRHWTSRDRTRRVYDEMWSGDWWWRMQYLIGNENGTVVPLIISTDKTTMTNNPLGDMAHPVYLSIGNISKTIRRKPTKRAMVLVGYLPVDSFKDVKHDDTRRRFRCELFHRSLACIFEPLKTASSEGELAWCADGYLRHIYPVIASWVADWPEQNDVAGTTQGGCPKCMQVWKKRGQGGPSARPREQSETINAVRAYKETGRPAALKPLRLRGVMPFWTNIANVEIATCLTPDLLHQLYKGMFEHARDWAEDLLGTKEFNRRFKSMPKARDLRYFKNGVTTVKAWAGRESREMAQQLLAVVIDAQVPINFVRMIRALLDFSYIAHGTQLTETDLTKMDEALAMFHRTKHVLIDEEMVLGPGSFNRIAKLHMLSHYTNDIRELGTPDGYSTETPEHLHIVYVKIPWRASNRRDPLPQMVKYVQRLEAIHVQRAYIEEFYGEDPGFDLEDFERHALDDDQDDVDKGDMSGCEECEEDEEDQVEVEPKSDLESGEVESEMIHYPRPRISIGRRPT